jgi:exopolysaccharide biosynthesis polyprenyl glycosylphosphotransferase
VFPSSNDLSASPADLTLYPDLPHQSQARGTAHILKRVIDVAGSLFLLCLLAPLMMLVALAIKLNSKGPVIFRQARVGQYGKPFSFWKFRSMYVDNDAAIHKDYVTNFISHGQPAGETEPVYKITNDPRITPVGGFIRKTSLDEIPQLWNVLRGEMSLVGPRPPLPYEFDCYVLWHRRRILEAKPGITGLWQVTGRSRTTFNEMVRLDLRYVKQWSIWLDIKILLRTPKAILGGEGAY